MGDFLGFLFGFFVFGLGQESGSIASSHSAGVFFLPIEGMWSCLSGGSPMIQSVEIFGGSVWIFSRLAIYFTNHGHWCLLVCIDDFRVAASTCSQPIGRIELCSCRAMR